jgi:group II intron reverse transcriptase/maturase
LEKSRPRQLLLPFAESPQGDDRERRLDESGCDARSVHRGGSSQRSESTSLAAGAARRLLEQAASSGNLKAALLKVFRNKGAPGVDGQSVKQVWDNRSELLPRLQHALLSETYVPGDIRRVWIPKPGGGKRGLGIPNVVDRWAAQALLQILEPIYEPTFHPSSHGFRPGRGAQTAIAEAMRYLKQGHRFVADLDLEKFFDQVHHQRLLDRLAQRVKDRRILRIIRLMLKAKVVMPEGTRVKTREGTPQGGPLSPLLSNIVLDELDRELSRRGLRFVRYADDCQIFAKSRRAGERIMASTTRFIESRLRLKVNQTKSAVDFSGRRHFLGFRLGASRSGWLTVNLSGRSFERIKTRIQELTPRNWGGSLNSCMDRLTRYLRGWMGYFHLCTQGVYRTLRYLDGHIRRRLRVILIRQKKRARHLYRHLCKHGASRRAAKTTAYSRRGPWWQSRSSGMHQAYPNSWFNDRLVSLVAEWQNRRFDWRPLWELPI